MGHFGLHKDKKVSKREEYEKLNLIHYTKF